MGLKRFSMAQASGNSPQRKPQQQVLPCETIETIAQKLAATLEPRGLRGPSVVAKDLSNLALASKQCHAATYTGFSTLSGLVQEVMQHAWQHSMHEDAAFIIRLSRYCKAFTFVNEAAVNVGAWQSNNRLLHLSGQSHWQGLWLKLSRDPYTLTVPQLKDCLRSLDLPTSGLKSELVDRLLSVFDYLIPTMPGQPSTLSLPLLVAVRTEQLSKIYCCSRSTTIASVRAVLATIGVQDFQQLREADQQPEFREAVKQAAAAVDARTAAARELRRLMFKEEQASAELRRLKQKRATLSDQLSEITASLAAVERHEKSTSKTSSELQKAVHTAASNAALAGSAAASAAEAARLSAVDVVGALQQQYASEGAATEGPQTPDGFASQSSAIEVINLVSVSENLSDDDEVPLPFADILAAPEEVANQSVNAGVDVEQQVTAHERSIDVVGEADATESQDAEPTGTIEAGAMCRHADISVQQHNVSVHQVTSTQENTVHGTVIGTRPRKAFRRRAASQHSTCKAVDNIRLRKAVMRHVVAARAAARLVVGRDSKGRPVLHDLSAHWQQCLNQQLRTRC